MNGPSHLYKYRSLRTNKEKQFTARIFTHNQIYFSKYTEFNDPFDCNFYISIIGNVITHKAKLQEINPGLSDAKLDINTRKDLKPKNLEKRKKSIQTAIRQINRGIGIFSMSARCDNLLMWSHYADCHRGICVEFKVTGGKLFGCDLCEVNYEEEYPKLSVYDDIDLEWTKRYLTTKACDWRYEQEWRIVYRETGCQVFPSEELTGAILGARISKKDKKLVLEWMSKSRSEVKLYQAREYDDKFGLDITPVEY
jgi:hypothetical protein